MPGYSVEQTLSEIQKMIDGARAKGFAPEDPNLSISSTARNCGKKNTTNRLGG